jgi:hypothetical protein
MGFWGGRKKVTWAFLGRLAPPMENPPRTILEGGMPLLTSPSITWRGREEKALMLSQVAHAVNASHGPKSRTCIMVCHLVIICKCQRYSGTNACGLVANLLDQLLHRVHAHGVLLLFRAEPHAVKPNGLHAVWAKQAADDATRKRKESNESNRIGGGIEGGRQGVRHLRRGMARRNDAEIAVAEVIGGCAECFFLFAPVRALVR